MAWDWFTPTSTFMFLYIYRDPRAVWLSQKTATNPMTGATFSDNPVITAFFWRRHIAAFHKWSRNLNILGVQYERLILKNKDLCKELESHFGLPASTLDPGLGDYSNMIAPDHKEIHSDISSGPII